MCFYITATLPPNKEMEKVKVILNKHGMKLLQINNKPMKSYLLNDEVYFRPTSTYCDCDTSLGVFNRQREYDELLQSKKVKHLRKKNWTEEQVDNCIKEKLSNTEPKLKKSITFMERENDIKKWFSLIHDIISLENISHIGILKHWYQSSLENEVLKVKKREKVNIAEIDKEFLFNIEDDVLYEFSIKT